MLLIKSNWSEENNILNKTEESYDLSIFNFKIDKASDIDFQKRLGKEIIIINSNDSVRYLDKFGMPVKKMSSIEAMESVINPDKSYPTDCRRSSQ